jgi:hypothetical protein
MRLKDEDINRAAHRHEVPDGVQAPRRRQRQPKYMKTKSKCFDAKVLVPRLSRVAALLCCGLLLFGQAWPVSAGGKCNQSPGVLPPHSHAYGKSLGDWMELYMVQLMERVHGTKTLPTKVGNVQFLPASYPAASSHADVTVKAGTALLWVPIVWVGEEYPDGSVDDPSVDWLAGTIGEFTLDDRTIVPDLEKYYVPIRWLENPVVYQDAMDWGSIAAVYLEGYAFLIAPLPVGVHTFTSTVWVLWLSEDPIFDASFTITVIP